jgi:hypothetical protein
MGFFGSLRVFSRPSVIMLMFFLGFCGGSVFTADLVSDFMVWGFCFGGSVFMADLVLDFMVWDFVSVVLWWFCFTDSILQDLLSRGFV